MNKTCFNKRDLEKHCQKLLNILTKRSYDKTETIFRINKVIAIPRNEKTKQKTTKNYFFDL